MTDEVVEAQRYFEGVARARYAVRKAFRIVDEQAKRAGLEPLQHQALIQAYGSGDELLRVNEIADRLDIAPAFASRLIRDLVQAGLVERKASERDRRITLVEVTDAGRAMLEKINAEVRIHLEFFHHQLRPEERLAALTVFALYVGVPLDASQARSIFDAASA
jgi:DNA-binding MarR family transcriptional regulator